MQDDAVVARDFLKVKDRVVAQVLADLIVDNDRFEHRIWCLAWFETQASIIRHHLNVLLSEGVFPADAVVNRLDRRRFTVI